MPSEEELKTLQALPLELKIRKTEQRIREWVDRYGEDGVCVSFSGGKDSTVLLHIVRKLYPSIEAVYVDTGLEYPQLREHVKTFDNVTWLKPEMNFRKVITTYGYPVVSKDVALRFERARRGLDGALKYVYGTAVGSDGRISSYCVDPKFRNLMEAPFEISPKCCDIMKKKPLKEYQKKVGKKPIMGTMASESRNRKRMWLLNGCNAFDAADPISTPLGFWTEQDILTYILKNKIEICSVYGDIVIDRKTGKFVLTGLKRTGCMFCMFGVHSEKQPNRFQRMQYSHPQIYDYCMKPLNEGGLGIKDVLEYMGVAYE